ncbi:kinesin-like protein KIF26B isoform X1 [Pygocentrus nattereri]|uniref:kinesin-like protein KIF26B isoform X1 n=1 Tax=Pygocentrus nattereri TaxID=42514 RepID=UPI001891059B|nr:kinesin-like protein KIF26B isoform X1 [Pygocentrus nattereri]
MMGSSEVARSQGYLAPRAKPASRSSSVPRAHRPPPDGAGACASSDSRAAPRGGADYSPRVRARARGGRVPAEPGESGAECWSSLDSGRLCEECMSRVEVLMEEAQRLLTAGHFNSSDPKLSLLLYESVQGPAWSSLGGRCDVCSTHLSQLKREAVRTLLSQDRTIWPNVFPASVSPGRSASSAHTLPRACSSHSPTPSPRHRPRNPRTDDWIREQSTLWPLSSTNDELSSFPEMMSQDGLKNNKADEKATSSGTVLCHFGSPLPFSASRVSTMLPAGTSAAISFIVRAVQKLNLTSRRRKQNNYCSRYPTNFSSLLQKAPPPAPSNLLQTACKGREMTETGKVKVLLRVSPLLKAGTSQLHALKLDLRKKQVTVLESATQSTQRLTAGATSTPKTFTFDAAFGPESSQAEVCEKSLFEVLQSVLAGADGCVLSFGQRKVGTSYTMIGRDDCSPSLGIIPCAISWLFKLINKKKDRTWANISVSVSAVEVCAETEVIRDLLSDVESGDCKDTHKPNVYLLDDPVCGTQLRNNSVLSAPTAERAAFLLDAALASRSSGVTGCREAFQHHCHMFYTLHICQQHIESSSKSGMNVDQSKLSLIDLGSCTRERNKNNTAVCLVDLGNVIMAKLNRHKHVPNKGSKLAMLMQESLNNVNCCTAIIAHVSTSLEDISETLCTIQIVSQIRRLQKKTRKSSSSSPGGRSSGKEKVNNSTRLRAFRSASTLDHDLSSLNLFDDLEDHSRSDKSSDTVICVDPNGCVLVDEEVKGSQEFVPIIPSLQRNKIDLKGSSILKRCELLKPISPCTLKKETKKQSSQQKTSESNIPDLECLKCNTFAELQNRLGCIDGSDTVGMYSCKEQTTNTNTVTKSEPLLSKATKISTGQPEIQGSSNKNESNEKEMRHPLQRDTPVKKIEEIPCRHAGQAKIAKKIIFSSPRLDIVSSSVQDEQATGSHSLAESMDMLVEGRSSDNFTMPSEVRISPVGKSSSSSFSVGLGSPVSLPITLGEGIPQFPIENQRQMKATITVTVQQPLDLNGHDELIYSVVEEVTINRAVNKDKAAQAAGITDSHSLESLPSGSQPVRIISSVGEEKTADNSASQVQALGQSCEASLVLPAVQNLVVSSQVDDASSPVAMSEKSQNIEKDVSEATFASTSEHEVLRFKEYSCDNGPEQKVTKRKCNQGIGQLSREINGDFSPVHQRILADFSMEIPENLASSYSALGKSKCTRDLYSLDKQYDSQDSLYHCMNPFSPRSTLERKQRHVQLGHMEWGEDSESMSSGQVSDRNRATKKKQRHVQPTATRCQECDRPNSDNMLNKTNPKSPVEESSKLFSAKLEQLANRQRSLGRSRLESSDLRFFEESNIVFTQGSSARLGSFCTSPRVSKRHLEQGHCMTLDSKASLDGDYALAQVKSATSTGLSDVFDDDLTVSRTGRSFRRVPRFFPMYDAIGSGTSRQSKPIQSKISTESKLSSPKVCKISETCPKNSCSSPKSARHSINRSSSLSPDGLSIKQISWSTQSLSRKQGKASVSFKSPSRVLNGRIELLRASGDSLSSSSLGSLEIDELKVSKTKMKGLTHTLPSPYSRITAPRKPSHCSGHASDNTSVLSGELPPAMCKTALLYNRNSVLSSGYESMMRDSEATCSSTSIHDSISDQSCFFNTAKGARSSKKRNNIGSYQRRPSQDTLLSLRRSGSGSKIRWVDRSNSDSYEIKVYEIDNVDGLQKRGKAGNKSVVCFSAKLKFLEHRQQRIAEVRDKYNALKRELELAKQHLMVDPGKWTREFDLWQTFEVDSLEHLEALELVTERLESQVSRCKALVMMVTSFDATPKRRQKKRCRPTVEYKGFIGI